jgi:PAS domain S-box-containing protein
MLGYQPGELLYRDWQLTVHSQDVEKIVAGHKRMLIDGRVEAEVLGVRKDNTTFWKQIVMVKADDEKGQWSGHYCFIKDITERKRAEEALSESEAKLEEAQRIAHVGYWENDLDADRITWSEETLRILGLRPGESYPTLTEFREKIHPEDRQIQAEASNRAQRGEGPYDVEYRVIRPDGEVRTLHSVGNVIRDDSGRPRRAFGVVQDVTERRRSEEALREYAQRLQVLSRSVVEVQEEERHHLARELHDEIGQVLSAVSVNLQALKAESDDAGGPRLDESIRIVHHATEQVRDLSMDLRPLMLDQLGLVSTIRWYADRQAQRSDFALEFVMDSSGDRFPADLEIALYRVVQEALTNVCRHADARHVRLELRQSDEEVRLVIHDDGVGFDVAAAQKKGSRGESFGVFGMRERVELFGGQIEIESKSGQGTAIHVRFPIPSTPLHPRE